MTNPEPSIIDIIRAAELALSNKIGSRITLGAATLLTEADRRNSVIRCRDETETIKTGLIIKKTVFTRETDDQNERDLQRFTNDWAGAEFLSSLDSDPPLVPLHVRVRDLP